MDHKLHLDGVSFQTKRFASKSVQSLASYDATERHTDSGLENLVKLLPLLTLGYNNTRILSSSYRFHQVMTDASVWLMACSNSEDVIMHVNRLMGAIDVAIRELFISWTVSLLGDGLDNKVNDEYQGISMNNIQQGGISKRPFSSLANSYFYFIQVV